MNDTKLYPAWKEAKKKILGLLRHTPYPVVPWTQLEEWLEEKHGTQEFQFAYLSMAESLKAENVWLMRIPGGRKVATESERVNILARNRQRRICNGLRTQDEMLRGIDVECLNDDERDRRDRLLLRNSMTISMIAANPLHKLKVVPEKINERVKLIED